METAAGSASLTLVLQLFAATASAVAILISAYVAWRVQRKIAISRATIDFISKHEVSNPEWSEARRVFVEITSQQDHPSPMIALLDPKTLEQQRQYLVITSLLSHFEAVAVAIKHEAMSEDIYKDWNRSAYVRAWRKSQSYINERREKTQRSSIYKNFEDLAKKWDREDESRPHSMQEP